MMYLSIINALPRRILYFILIIGSFSNSCQNNNTKVSDCSECPLKMVGDSTIISTSEKSSSGIELKSEIDIDDLNKKVSDLNLSGKINLSEVSINETTILITTENEDFITSHNLFRNVTCALIWNICNNQEMNDSVKSDRIESLLREFKEDLSVIHQPPASGDDDQKTNDNPHPDSKVISPSTEGEKIFNSTERSSVAFSFLHNDKEIKKIFEPPINGAIREVFPEEHTINFYLFSNYFLTTLKNRLDEGELNLLNSTGADSYTSCVCLLVPNRIEIIDSESIEGGKVAILSLDLKLINLLSQSITPLSIGEIRATGYTETDAARELAEKLKQELSDNLQFFKQCKN